MSVKRLYEGHYRALEEDFLDLAGRIVAKGDKLTVITAGAGQLGRLRNLLACRSENGITGGVDFLPGIGHLARMKGPVPAPFNTVSHSDRTLFSLRAMECLNEGEPLFDLRNNTETAHSMGSFFETLFEHGITAELYNITSLSLSEGQSITEAVIGRILGVYEEERNRNYSSLEDMVLERAIPGEITGSFIFYGFYDLNPLQRRYIRRFMKVCGCVYWFSPVPENSQWGSIYFRTRSLLQETGIDSVIRSGNRMQMNSFAGFFESLPKQLRPAVPVSGFRITASSGETGACRTVLKRICELNRDSGIDFSQIAVVRRKQDAGSLVRMAQHEGISVNAPLKVKLSQMPEGVFVLNLLTAVSMDFYYVYLENLLASGILGDLYAANPSEIAETVESSGIRLGLARWRDWYSTAEDGNRLASFLRALDSFFSGLPAKATALEYFGLLRKFFEKTVQEPSSTPVAESLFDRDVFGFSGEISLLNFTDSLRFFYESKDIVLREADPEGFRVITIEQIRGNLFRSVLLMDMEEGVYPGSPGDDPRLSDELREKLQMTLKSEREIEDGFLLRQAGEAAEETLDIVYREQDSSGEEVSPSPFISSTVLSQEGYSPDPAWFSRSSSSPVEQLLSGLHPGQIRARAVTEGEYPLDPVFLNSLKAERSRMDYRGFNEYDGILDSSPVAGESFSPTFLERYIRCPFAFLMERGWKTGRVEVPEISSSPDPMIKGSIIHEAVEKVLESRGFHPSLEDIAEILAEVSSSHELTGRLGTDYLQQIFLEKETGIISESLRNMSLEGWKFLESEKFLEGHLGEMRINGIVDLILEDRNSDLVLVDLKTGKLPDLKDIDKGKLYQLPFYFALARENYPDRQIASVAYASVSKASPGKMKGLKGEEMEDRMKAVSENAKRIVSMMRDGLFPPVPSSRCDYCVYRGACRISPWERIRAKAQSDGRIEMLKELMLKK
jgi:RecB family exonuclease